MKPTPKAGATLIVLLAALAGPIAPAYAEIDEVRVGVVHNLRLDHATSSMARRTARMSSSRSFPVRPTFSILLDRPDLMWWARSTPATASHSRARA